MSWTRIAPSLALVLASFASAQPQVPRPAAVRRQVKADGAKATIARLQHDSQFEGVLANIERGAKAWLGVAAALRPGADAAAATGLNFAVARALPRAPATVLGLIGSPFGLEQVCTVPYIEPEQGVERRYLKAAKAALERRAASNLEAVRAKCLARIVEAEGSK